MKLRSGSLFLIFILLLMVYAALESVRFGHTEAMLAPLLLSLTILVLGIIELARELRAREKPLRSVEDEDLPPMVVTRNKGGSPMGRFGMALGWIGGFALGIYLLGFFLSTLLFAFLYLKVQRRGWLQSTGFAVGFMVLLYLIFKVGLRSQLYRGILFGG
jgi:hypothetical protein